jgi:hypothetical protein
MDPLHIPFVPAKAGTQRGAAQLDSRFRGNERNKVWP